MILDRPRARRGGVAEWALAAISALSVALAALAAELALRATHPAFLRHSRIEHPHVYSEAYGWALRPGAHHVGRDGETITVNASGYRGARHDGPAPPGVKRVLMLGDSITFGTGVSDGQTFSDRLDALPGFEVVNLGVDGYGTDQELIRFEREGLALHPRVVVLNFCLRNDWFDNALPVALYDGRSVKPYFTLEGGGLVRHDGHLKLSRRQRVAVAVMERSYLVNALLLAGGAATDEPVGEDRDEADWGERRKVVMADFDRTAAVTRRLILAIGERAAAEGAAFVVAVHPDRRSWDGDDSMVTPLTSGGLGRTRLVIMKREYEARALRFEDLTIDRLGHLGPAGHAAASEIIHAVLDEVPP